jgi:hypothetical protein
MRLFPTATGYEVPISADNRQRSISNAVNVALPLPILSADQRKGAVRTVPLANQSRIDSGIIVVKEADVARPHLGVDYSFSLSHVRT